MYLNELVIAQGNAPKLLPAKDPITDSVVITGNCWGAVQKDSLPLFIIDGRLSSYEEVRALDIDTIQKVDILKMEKTDFSCNNRTANGVVVIVTKSIKGQVFQITDAGDNTGVNAATVTFTDHKNDSIRLIADSAGKLQTSTLKYNVEYKVRVTSIGYKDFTASYKRSKEKPIQQFRLSRDVKESQEVIVKSYGYRRVWCRGGCGGTLVKYAPLKKAPKSAAVTMVSKVYPNPVAKGRVFKVEFELAVPQLLQVRIFNLQGAQLSNTVYHSNEGVNRVEVPVASHWASGVYAVQMIDDNGELLLQNKIIVQ